MSYVDRLFRHKDKNSAAPEYLNQDYLRLMKEGPVLMKLNSLRPTYSKSMTNSRRRVLIVMTALIGEFVVSIPAIRAFIKKNPDVLLDLLVSSSYAELAKRIIGVNNVYLAQSVHMRVTEMKISEKIPKGVYDDVYVMRISKSAYTILRKIMFQNLHPNSVNLLKYFFSLASDKKNIILQYHNLAYKLLDLPAPKILPEPETLFNFSNCSSNKINSFPFLKTKYVVIHAASGWRPRLWFPERWAELSRLLHEDGYNVVFIGAGQKDLVEYSKILSNTKVKVYSLIDKISSWEVVCVIKNASVLIGIDSGPRNIADILGVPNIGMLGPSVYNFKPLRRYSYIIDKLRRKHPGLVWIGSSYPLDAISVKEVYSIVNKIRQSRHGKGVI